jgi:uncharacterized damage-inducible protein DinB
MGAYNRWMNERLYEVCAGLSDEERKRDRGAFFASIHATLNHLLLGDRLWMGRFTKRPYDIEGLDQELFGDFGELRRERGKTDQAIIDWAETLTEDMLMASFEFQSFVNPKGRRCPLWVTTTHFFNHQTHHRGQLTTLLSQCQRDCGVTDLIWTPGLVEEFD